ncbi:hypothetical protein [Dyadobacter sp. BHUBP1]|uniref:hypothetical protein n=1 Tax=Dyadobacter sp. BHUBP1 TaxID=3424178 RepID=UPI003D339D73
MFPIEANTDFQPIGHPVYNSQRVPFTFGQLAVKQVHNLACCTDLIIFLRIRIFHLACLFSGGIEADYQSNYDGQHYFVQK